MKFNNKESFKRYLVKLIKEEKKIIEKSMEEEEVREEETHEKEVEEGAACEEAYIPKSIFTNKINESKANRSALKVKKAFNMLKEGQINRKRFYLVVERITGCETKNTYVTTDHGNISLRRFIRNI